MKGRGVRTVDGADPEGRDDFLEDGGSRTVKHLREYGYAAQLADGHLVLVCARDRSRSAEAGERKRRVGEERRGRTVWTSMAGIFACPPNRFPVFPTSGTPTPPFVTSHLSFLLLFPSPPPPLEADR